MFIGFPLIYTPLFSQSYSNTILVNGGNTFFPDWMPRTHSFGLGYSRNLTDWKLNANIFACISNENLIYEPALEFSYETVYYDEIQYRNLIVLDILAGYNLIGKYPNMITFFLNCGLSFIKGEEVIIESIWYGNFPESETTTNFRKHLGINAGFDFSYYPLKHIGIGIYSTGHIYTKYDPDLNIGFNLLYRFGD